MTPACMTAQLGGSYVLPCLGASCSNTFASGFAWAMLPLFNSWAIHFPSMSSCLLQALCAACIAACGILHMCAYERALLRQQCPSCRQCGPQQSRDLLPGPVVAAVLACRYAAARTVVSAPCWTFLCGQCLLQARQLLTRVRWASPVQKSCLQKQAPGAWIAILGSSVITAGAPDTFKQPFRALSFASS
jgi:hypothetical protein